MPSSHDRIFAPERRTVRRYLVHRPVVIRAVDRSSPERKSYSTDALRLWIISPLRW